MEALQKAEQELQAILKSESPLKIENGQPSRIPVEVESSNPRGFGGGYKAKPDTGGSLISHVDGGYEAEAVKTIRTALVTFEYVPSTDAWVPVSYYPEVR